MKGNGKRILSIFLVAVIAVTTVWYAPPQFTASASWKTNMEKALELLASPSEASKQESTATPSEAEILGREATPSEAEIPDGKATPSQAVKKFVRVEPEEIPEYYSQVSASGKRFWKFEDRNGMVQYRDYGYLQGDAEFPLWYETDLTGAVDDTYESVNLDEEYYSLAPYIWKSEEPNEKNWPDLEQQYQILITGKEKLQFDNWDGSNYDIWHLKASEIQTNHQNENLPDDDYSEVEYAENDESYLYNEEPYQQEIKDLYFFYGHEKNGIENSNSKWLVSDSNGCVSFPSFSSMLAAKSWQDDWKTLNLYFYNNLPGETKTSSASYVKQNIGKFRRSYLQNDNWGNFTPLFFTLDWALPENTQKIEFPYMYKEGYEFLGYLPEYASQYVPGSLVNFANNMQLNPQKYDYLVGYNPNFKEPTTGGDGKIINVPPSQFGFPLGKGSSTKSINDSTGFVVISPGSEIEARLLIGGINRKYCTDRPSSISFYGIWLKKDLSRLTLIDDVSKLYSDWGYNDTRIIETNGNYYRSISLKEKGTKVDISYLLNSNPFRGYFYYHVNKTGSQGGSTGVVHTHDRVFGGYWSEPNGKGKQLSKIYTYDKDDDKYYAYWIPVGSKFNVRYQDENGNQIGFEQIIEASRKSTPPEAPLKEGYNFIGWKSIDGDNSTPDVISKNVTFGPEYEQKNIRYKVTFKDWDGTILNEQNIPYGDSALEPRDPKRDGYAFNGWSQPLDNIRWDTEIDAQYLKLYKLTLDAGDGKIFDSQTHTIQIKEGMSLQDLGIDLNVLISSTVKSGSKCSNYNNGTENLYSSFKINDDETFKAVYTKNITNIKFYPMLPGGYAGSYNAVNVNQMEPLNYNYYSSYTSQKYKGYTFLGWCDNSLGKGRIINNGDIVPEDISTILYGIWKADDIVYNVDYGPINDTTLFPKRLVLPSWVDDKTLATQYLPKYNDLPQLINGYTLPSSNATTWTNTNQNYNFGEGITTTKLPTDSEVFLKWNANSKRFYYFAMYPNSNNVGYKMVSGKSGSGKTHYGQMMAPDDIAKLNDVTLIPPGAVFHGWYEGNSTTPLQPIDLTKPLTPKDSGSKSSSDLYLYIYMVCANQSSKITFKDWDGTILSEKMVNYGDPIEMPKPNRDGYDFIGWDVHVNENTKFASDTTITAQYEEPGFKIILFANGGKFVEVNESGQTVQLDSKILKIDDVSNLEEALSQSNLFLGENASNLKRAGYTFDWFDDSTAGNPVSQINKSDILKHKKNLYARWVNAYTVTFKDWNARVIDEQVVIKNQDAKLPEEPKREGYAFVGWSQSHQNIMANTTLTAKYETVMEIKFRRYNLNQAETLEEFYDEKIVNAGIWPTSNTDNDAKLLWGLSANSEKVQFPILESEGDIFLGWTRSVNQGGPSSSKLASEKNYNGTVSQIYNNFYARTQAIAASKYDSPYAIGNVTPGFPLIPAGTEVEARAFMSPKADSYMAYNGVWIPKDKPSLILINGFKDCFGGFGFRFIDETNFLNYSTVVAKNVEMIESISVAPSFGSKFNDLKLRDKVLTDIGIPLSLTNKYKGNDDSYPEEFYAIRKFVGYFSETNGRGTKLDSNYVFDKVGDKYYAYYVPKAQKFKVIYQDENGTIITASQIDAGKAVTNVPKAPVKPGYEFVEWETFIGGNSNSTQILRDTTFRPKYQKEKAQTYILTLAGNDGTFNGTDLMMEYQVEQGHSLTEYLHDAELHMFNPGNVFVGWFTDNVNGIKVNYSDSMPSNNLTIYAQWNPLTFNVVYKNWNGDVLKNQEIAIGADATPPENPERAGYAFTGWDKPSTNIQNHTTIMAKYTANRFTLTLNGNGGTIAGDETKSQTISFEESIDQVLTDGVAKASRKYYTFDGWYTMPTGGSKYIGSGNTMPASSVTIYAHWVRNSSEVVYKDWNGNVLKTQEVAIGADAIPPSNPVRAGYEFTGWDKVSTNILNHTTITAQYTANRFTLTLDGNGGTIAGDETKNQMISFGESIDQVLTDGAGKAKRKYYTFDGWYTAPTGESKYTGSGNTMPASSVTVYAHWVRISSEVVYKDWNGDVLKTQEVAIGADATPPLDPVRAGYAFTGWDKPFTNILNHTTITAQYTANRFMLTLDGNGGTLAGDETKSQMIFLGESIDQVLTDGAGKAKRKYYTFDGWYTMPIGGIQYTGSGNTMPASSVTVYAHWERNSSEVVYKDWNGDVLKIQEVTIGADATPPSDPVRAGYAFTGWDKASTNIQNHTTITAQYKANLFALTLDGNGGTIAGEETKSHTLSFGESIDQVLTDETGKAKRKYYTFDGWYTMPTGGSKYTGSGNTMPASSVTVYAHWERNSSEVVYKDWNGEVLKTQEVAIGADATPPSDPVRAGYAFTGWDKASTNIQNHTTITAQYKANLFTLTLDGNGGTIAGDETKSQMISFGESMDQILEDGAAKASRKYYTFDGWYTESTGGNKYTVSGNTMPDSSVTVYAHWVRNSSEVVYKDWNGDVLKTQEVAIGADATPPEDPVRPGYTFIGWDKQSTNIQSNTTIMAVYTANDYKQTTEEKNNVAPVLVPPTIDTTTKPTVPDSGGKFIVNPENPLDVTYTKPDGTPAKDEWVGDGRDWYHVDVKGKINYDWYLEGEKTWYKFNQEKGDRFGAALIGWNHELMDDKRYFFDLTTTKMLTGWQNIDGKSYYFTTNNEGQTYFGSNLQGGSGWKYDPNRPGKPYGSMYRNEYTPDGYWVDENGVCADKK